MMKNQTSKRRCLLQQINEVSFAVNDILLYLDTHPDDEKALAFFEDVSDRLPADLRCRNWSPMEDIPIRRGSGN